MRNIHHLQRHRLWHWPVLVLVRYYVVRDTTPVEDAAMLTAIVGLSYLSWRYVETPFRQRTVSARRLVVVCAVAAGLLAAFAAATLAARGFPARLNANAGRVNAAVGTNYRCPIGDYLAFGASRGCVLALPSRSPDDADVVLLGNSHAQMFAPLVASILADHGLHGLLVPANGCLPWTATNIDVPCQATAAINLAAVLRLKARVVIVAFSWAELEGPLVDGAGRALPPSTVAARIIPLDTTIAALRRAGKRVIVVGPTAAPGWDVASMVSRDLAFGHPVERPLFTAKPTFDAQFGAAITAFDHRPDVGFIRPDVIQCRSGRCDYVIDGDALFADDNHLAAAATARFRPVFEPRIVAAAAR